MGRPIHAAQSDSIPSWEMRRDTSLWVRKDRRVRAQPRVLVRDWTRAANCGESRSAAYRSEA